MLGCQDFCGHYDWTFKHVRDHFGQAAVHELWRDAIGAESQNHYFEAGKARGLRGLYETWTKTGEDEHCDWTFHLDESRNVLRWDMRKCPSKGFLLGNDLHHDEDYCDHCMGWMIPLLDRVGVDIAVHEHNHAGQCWGEMRARGVASQPLTVGHDIRRDARWAHGHVERWEAGVKLPILSTRSPASDPVAALDDWFREKRRIIVLGRGASARGLDPQLSEDDAVFVTGPTYATRDVYAGEPAAVLLGDRPTPEVLRLTAERYAATPIDRRPLLLHTYLPALPPIAWQDFGLPRPAPILPTLIRAGVYVHVPDAPYPTTGVFLVLLGVALGKAVDVAGIDLYMDRDGHVWPARHSLACDRQHLDAAQRAAGDRLRLALRAPSAAASAAPRA